MEIEEFKSLLKAGDRQETPFVGVHSTNVFVLEQLLENGVLPVGDSLHSDNFYFTPVQEEFREVDEAFDEGTTREGVLDFNSMYAKLSSVTSYLRRNAPDVGRPSWIWNKLIDVALNDSRIFTQDSYLSAAEKSLSHLDREVRKKLTKSIREAFKFDGVHILLADDVKSSYEFDPEAGNPQDEEFVVTAMRIPYLGNLSNGISVEYFSGIHVIGSRDRKYLKEVLNKKSNDA